MPDCCPSKPVTPVWVAVAGAGFVRIRRSAPRRAALLLGGVLGAALAWPGVAAANASSCYSIRDADRKNICLAMAKGQDSYCYSVRESDAKNQCLAVVKNQRSYCYSIRSSDSKNQCLAQVR